MSAIHKLPSADKTVQRRLFLEKRRALLKEPRKKAALDDEIQSRLILSPAYRDCDAVLLYAARENEIATAMIFYAALANHKTVALPRCEEDGTLRFYRVRSTADLAPGRFGIEEPVTGCEPFAPDARTLCVCPCLCCDMRGYRLGYGGGWYDRFLADYPGVTAALCYADALLPELRHEEFDIPVQLIVTDSYIRDLR